MVEATYSGSTSSLTSLAALLIRPQATTGSTSQPEAPIDPEPKAPLSVLMAYLRGAEVGLDAAKDTVCTGVFPTAG